MGVPLSTKRRKLLINRLMELLPKGVSKQAVIDSVAVVGDIIRTEEELDNFLWLLAGNTGKLKLGKPAYPWRRHRSDEWMPLQIVSSYPRRDYKDALGCDFVFRVLAGSACPMLVSKFWTLKFCRFVATQFGFSRRGTAQFEEPSQFVGLRLHAFFEAGGSGRHPFFQKVHVAFADHNRWLLKSRARVDFDCPNGFMHPCYKCHVGYDQCPVGTHPKTFVPKFCPSCETESLFDPSKPKVLMCVNCQIKESTQHARR